MALLGTAGLIWFVIREGDDPVATSTPTTVVEVSTSASVASSTVAPTTLPVTTVAETSIVEVTTVAPSVPSAPAFTLPTVPAAAVFEGPGVAYTVADPLPSGLAFVEVQASLLVSQAVADLLAAHQWESARLSYFSYFDGVTTSPTVEELEARWGTSTRISLLLLDAQKDPAAGYVLLVGAVANLQDGTTSVFCNHLYADPLVPAVVDLGNASPITQGARPLMPEQLVNDPAQLADLSARCIWS